MITISRTELNNIKQIASGHNPIITSQKSKDIELKRLSQERIAKWPNTLEAIRHKKESYAAEKILEREQYLAQIDKDEEIYKLKERNDALLRAETILYERKDNMKLLRSKILYTDVLDTRSKQLIEKQERLKKEEQEKAEYYEIMKKQIKKAEEIEQLKLQKQKANIQSIAQTRIQQLNEMKSRHNSDQAEAYALGQAMKEQAQLDYIESIRKQEENEIKIKDANNNMIIFNQKLKEIKTEIQHKEDEAQKIRYLYYVLYALVYYTTLYISTLSYISYYYILHSALYFSVLCCTIYCT